MWQNTTHLTQIRTDKEIRRAQGLHTWNKQTNKENSPTEEGALVEGVELKRGVT